MAPQLRVPRPLPLPGVQQGMPRHTQGGPGSGRSDLGGRGRHHVLPLQRHAPGQRQVAVRGDASVSCLVPQHLVLRPRPHTA
eukprot:5873196-Alexandrium_andersonii.AAC.1